MLAWFYGIIASGIFLIAAPSQIKKLTRRQELWRLGASVVIGLLFACILVAL